MKLVHKKVKIDLREAVDDDIFKGIDLDVLCRQLHGPFFHNTLVPEVQNALGLTTSKLEEKYARQTKANLVYLEITRSVFR